MSRDQKIALRVAKLIKQQEGKTFGGSVWNDIKWVSYLEKVPQSMNTVAIPTMNTGLLEKSTKTSPS